MLYDPKWKLPVINDAVREILLEAACIIERDGWTQYELHSEKGYCLLGALDRAIDERWEESAMDEFAKVYDRVLSAIPRYVSIMHWNDAPGRTKEEVLKVLYKAAGRS